MEAHGLTFGHNKEIAAGLERFAKQLWHQDDGGARWVQGAPWEYASERRTSAVAYNLSIYCPHCRKHTALSVAPAKYTSNYEDRYTAAAWEKSERKTWWLGICNACKEPSIVLNEGEVVYPTPLPAPTDPAVPAPMRSDLDEAKRCMGVNAYRGCAVMARRAMQSAAIDKGAKSDKLAKQFVELYDDRKITQEVKEWADAVRWVGNDAAHPGGMTVAKEDAEDVLKLAEQLLHVLYVAPSLAANLRKRAGK